MESNLFKIGEVEDGSGYDWSETGAFISLDDGRFRVESDSGCSCNYPYMGWADADYGPPLSATEACAEVMKCDVPYGMSVTDYRSDCLYLCDLIKKADREFKAGTFKAEDFG